jgi:hypothetical protein
MNYLQYDFTHRTNVVISADQAFVPRLLYGRAFSVHVGATESRPDC